MRAGDVSTPAAASTATTATALSVMSPALARLGRRLAEAAVDSVHEHVCRPESGAVAVPSVVVAQDPGSFDLLQRHTLPNGIPESIPDDRDHVAVLDDVGFVGETAVSRNDVRAALLFFRRHCQLDDAVQCIDDALNASSLGSPHEIGRASCRERV